MTKMKNIGSRSFLKLLLVFSLSAFFFISNTNTAQAQTGDDEILIAAEEMPSFPGGDKSLHAALYKNLVYPEDAFNNNIEGKVLIRFVISKDGAVTNASVLRSADPALDKAALEAVKRLPKFNPGKQGGKPVNVWYTLPIVFKIQ